MTVCQGIPSSGFEISNVTSVSQSNSHSVPAPLIAGIILGVVFVVVLLIGVVIYALRRRRLYRKTLDIGELGFSPGTLLSGGELEGSERCEMPGSEKCGAGWTKAIPPPRQQKLPTETGVVELSAGDIPIAELQSPILGIFHEMPDSTTRASAISSFGFWGNRDNNPGTASSSSGLNNSKRQSVPPLPHRSQQNPHPFSYPETEIPPPYSRIVTRFPIQEDYRTNNGAMTFEPPSPFLGSQQRVADDGYQRNMSMASHDFISAQSHLSAPLSNVWAHFQSPRRKNSMFQSASAVLATHSPQTLYGQSPISPLQSSPLGHICHKILKSPMVDMISQLPDTPPPSARLSDTFRPHCNIYDEISPVGPPLPPPGPSESFVEEAWVSDSWEIAESPRTMPTLVSDSNVPINQSVTDYANFQNSSYSNAPFDLGELGSNTELRLPEEHNQPYEQDLFSSSHILLARESTEQPVKCPTCGEQFHPGSSVFNSLRRHIKEQHLDKRKSNLCPLCGKGYSRDSYLRKHVCQAVNPRKHAKR